AGPAHHGDHHRSRHLAPAVRPVHSAGHERHRSLTETQPLRRKYVRVRTENVRMLKSAVVVMVTLCPVVTGLAETPPPTPPIALHRAAGPITVDGDLSDPGWQAA